MCPLFLYRQVDKQLREPRRPRLFRDGELEDAFRRGRGEIAFGKSQLDDPRHGRRSQSGHEFYSLSWHFALINQRRYDSADRFLISTEVQGFVSEILFDAIPKVRQVQQAIHEPNLIEQRFQKKHAKAGQLTGAEISPPVEIVLTGLVGSLQSIEITLTMAGESAGKRPQTMPMQTVTV